ncbi:MAG: SLBB domain-containing protein [Candidatus Izemoplasmatales bacterium]|nr:SLBB domain-containing protein [Candidatus Izemoplasmatales bacterium]
MKKYLPYLLALLGFAGFMFFSVNDSFSDSDYKEYNIINTFNTNENDDLIYVEIRGEVRYPDVYRIPEDSILKTLIEMAGGLTEEADISEINQAEVLIGNSLVLIPKIENEFLDEEDETGNALIYIDIKGEVVNPGVYQVLSNLRMHEIIEIAGGLTLHADVSNINMSQMLYDGAMISIPKRIDSDSISVYIGGAVSSPGYYQLVSNSTLDDLIVICGGLTDKADISEINRALVLENEDRIVIPEVEEIKKIYVSIKGEVINPDVYYVFEGTSVSELITLAGGLTDKAVNELINYDQLLVLGSVVTIPGEIVDNYRPIENPTGIVNINTASLLDLQTLKGIGEILAQRIIDYRLENGAFKNIQEIMLVSGIKTSIYEQIKNNITV